MLQRLRLFFVKSACQLLIKYKEGPLWAFFVRGSDF